jgi:hypothetical protein
VILLLLPLKCWDYTHALTCSALVSIIVHSMDTGLGPYLHDVAKGHLSPPTKVHPAHRKASVWLHRNVDTMTLSLNPAWP